MNRRQRLVQERFLDNEEAVIRELKRLYGQSLNDITQKAKELQGRIDGLQMALDGIEDAAERQRLKSMIRSKVYQKQYQEALKKQIGSILDNMHVEEFKTVSGYLKRCYEDGFMGAMYDISGQGIPLIIPLDQEAMIRAVQLDSKLSSGLYSRLGEDVVKLKRKVTAQISRGVSTGMSFQQIGQQLAGHTNIGYNNAVRIARTEGHRVQVQSGMDACARAKENGCDVVKQWDATLDARTRDSHARVDGEIRELDEKFSNGLMFPGDPNGGVAEVVNCRCALLQRARWALDADELSALKERAEFFGLDKAESFAQFRTKYLKAAENVEKSGGSGIIKLPDIQIIRSLGAKSKRYDVMDLKTGEYFSFVEGTRIQNVEVFAGKGTKNELRIAEKYADKYGGRPQDWQHVKGQGILDTDDGERKAEIHWMQCEGCGKHDFFVKKWED